MNSPLRDLLKHTKKFKPKIILASTFSVINKLFDIAPEILIGIAIDVVVNKETSFLGKFGINEPMHQIWTLAILTLLIWLFESISEYIYLINWRNLAQNIQHELRMEAYEHMQQMDMHSLEDRTTGELVSVLNDDVNQLERFLNDGANKLIQVFTTLIAIGGVFFYISPKIAVFATLPIPIIIFGAFFFQKKAQPIYKDVREKVGFLSARLANNISGITTIKSFATELFELKTLQRESLEYCESNRKAIALSSSFTPIIRMAVLCGFMGTFLYGGYLVLQGELNVGFYGVLVFLTQRLLWPMTDIAETVDLYERAMASTRRILDILNTEIEIKSGKKELLQHQVKGEIEFKNVSFSYKNRTKIIEDLNLFMPAGKTIGIVGSTGSGKSTIIKLLLRLYDFSVGDITIDGIKVNEMKLQDLRKSVGLVSQDVFLFHGTVAQNIAYGISNPSVEKIIEVAKIAEAHEFIEKLPNGYETLVGERGQKLSGGQRQRISIARAILKNPPIMILDEATSAVDNETEAAIQRSLQKIAVGRTTIIIAHRLSTITNADLIYVIENGRVQEQGTSQELIKKNGVYANLWKVQVGLTPDEII